MERASIPDDIKRFILVSIPSIPHLEAILLLRSHPCQAWRPYDVAKRLYISEKAAGALLAELQASGILEISQTGMDSYFYLPASDSLREIVDRLSEVHSSNLVGVTNLIHSKTDRKAQRFADAFLWRKED